MGGDRSFVGSYWGEREIEITPELATHYAESVEDFNPWYFGDSPFGGAVAPALTLHSQVYSSVDWYLSFFGNLHARQEWELFHPMLAGDTVTVRRQVVDRYFKSFLRAAANEGGMVVDKDREKRSDRKFDAAEETVIEEVVGPAKLVSIEMCRKFSPGKSYHNDVDEARKLGFPDVVVQGMMSLCFISEMMTNRFGEGWYQGGRMNVNLVNVLWQGETVTAGGAVTEEAPEGAKERANLRVWVDKADGTKVTVGTASALVP
jgi:acyl dehydratase